MRRSDFHFDLPEALIAQYPLARRGASRLLCLDAVSGAVTDRVFDDLADILHAGDLLVFNDTRVMPARLHGRKETGGRVELLIERLLSPGRALAHVRSSKSPRLGTRIIVAQDALLVVEGRQGDLFEISALDIALEELMRRHGHVPLPPYITRGDEDSDMERYQTVYARRPGAVAAPTAGLHFDPEMLQRLAQKGVGSAQVTLHVGAGTFQPVRSERLQDHHMHSEYVEVGEETCDKVARTRQDGGRVVAVGTTSVRSLESASASGELRPFRGDTRLFITPGYSFHCIDAMLTNFHLPESTLLMLVSAFAGHANVMGAYRHAVQQGYRFFSYGDAMFLTSLPSR